MDAVGERRPVGGGLVGADEGVGHVDVAGGSGDAGVIERIGGGESNYPGGALDDQLRQRRAVERLGADGGDPRREGQRGKAGAVAERVAAEAASHAFREGQRGQLVAVAERGGAEAASHACREGQRGQLVAVAERGGADTFLACVTLARNVTVAPGIGAPSGDSSPSEPSNTARIRRPVTRPYWTPLGILMVYF